MNQDQKELANLKLRHARLAERYLRQALSNLEFVILATPTGMLRDSIIESNIRLNADLNTMQLLLKEINK